MYSIPYSACSVIRKKTPPLCICKALEQKKRKERLYVLYVWISFCFFPCTLNFSISAREAASTEPYMCSYLSTYIYTHDYSESYIRRSHTMEHMNRESKEEEQVGELFQLEFEDLCAFLKKMMSNDLEVYLYVIIGFWEKFCCVFEELWDWSRGCVDLNSFISLNFLENLY